MAAAMPGRAWRGTVKRSGMPGWMRAEPAEFKRLERDIVVEVFLSARRCRRFPGRRGGAARAVAIAAATTAAATEHLHVVRDDLGGIAVAAFLVLPLASTQSALNIDL